MKNFKSFVALFIFLSCSFLGLLSKETDKDHKVLNASSLHLYSFLLDIKAVVQKIEAETTKNMANNVVNESTKNTDLRASLSPSQVVDASLRLIEEIVNSFNEGMLSYNPEVEYKFINTCNTLRDTPCIEARHLRLLKKKILKFDEYLQSYCLNYRGFLNNDEKAFFNKIIKLDYFLLNAVLRDEVLNNGLFKRIKDWFIYRPYEWMGDHPYLTTLSVATVLVLVGSFFFYPTIKKKWEEMKVERAFSEKVRACIEVKEVTGQTGLTCGAHAFKNLVAFAQDEGEDFNEADFLTKMRTELANLRKDEVAAKGESFDVLGSLGSDHLEPLVDKVELGECKQIQNHFVVFDSQEVLEQAVTQQVLEDKASGRKQAQAGCRIPHNILARIDDFKGKDNGQLYVLMNTAYTGKNLTGYGHWLPVKCEKREDGIHFTTGDSMGGNPASYALGMFKSLYTLLSGKPREPGNTEEEDSQLD